MFIPFFTHREKRSTKSLLRRKGGGGGGGRGGGGGGRSGGGASRGSTSSGTKSSASTGAKSGPSFSINSGGKGLKASPSGAGGGPKTVIPAGQPFAGREVGGGSRSQVYGSSTYGSGYPGLNGRGVQGRGFPFVFYPVVFSAPVGGEAYYLYREEEYGKADNSTRPGGPLRQVAFSSPNSTFHIVSDNTTVIWLQTAVNSSCHSSNTFTVSAVQPYNSSQSPYPRPEEAIQYYRASSVVLTLDGYNNTAALGTNETAPAVSLPPTVDAKLLACINQTIGATVPLVGAAGRSYTPSACGLLFIAWVLWLFESL
ncbi:hypothetical protein LshimejAT787_1104870 [Lyophyllum shimeji]|uniref:Uncharacterized protein n=1 Tax=Lyophyllum shimeji TaxID=47721 RepID=A0A9P3PTC9_LYOSH|nr:hypothetical protein LshimejAT787_1104870 [Lyophyllum shimeji]